MKSKISYLLFILIYSTGLRLVYSNKSLIKFSDQSDYVYLYEIDTFAKVKPNDHLKPSSLKFKSEISLTKQSAHEYALKFDKIEYDFEDENQASNSGSKIIQVLKKPFNFKLIDGEIKALQFDFKLNDPKLNEWIRKLYENLLLTLQLPLNDDIEQDEEISLSGEETFDHCQVNYQVKNRRRSFYEIKSIKNLANCLNAKPNKFMNKFLITSHQECDHLVRDNLLTEVHCLENNKANLFHVVQVINTKLKFLRMDDRNDVESSETTNLGQLSPTPADENVVESSKHLLNKICDQLKEQISPKITESLVSLGRTIRELNYNQLIEVYEHSNQIDECKDRQQFKDIFYSMIFQQNNAGAIRFLLERVDQPTDMFYSLLAFTARPTEDAVKLIIPKLNEQLNRMDRSYQTISYQTILGITAFLGNFCEQENCEQNEQLIRVQKQLIDRLGKRCSNEHHQILLLKCVQNIGILDQTMIEQVLPCLEQQKASAIRLAAIQLLDKTTIPNQRAIDKLKALFADPNEESELRINAFLILVKALKFDLDNALRDHLIKQLQNETNLQGKFHTLYQQHLMMTIKLIIN